MSGIDFESDAAPASGQGALERITALAQLMVQQEADVAAAELALSKAKQALFRTETEDLPDLMTELQLEELKLIDGSKVSVKRDYHCGLSEERRPEGLRWLDEHGFSGLIKTQVAVAFGRDEAEKAEEMAEKIAELVDRDVSLTSSVHAATLKSFVKEQMEAGDANALDADARQLFAVQPFNRAKLTAPRPTAPRRSRAK